MPNQLHHVVMLSHSAPTFIGFLTDVVGMEIQHSFPVPGEILETTLGWPPSEGANVTILGSGMAGLIEVLDVPEGLRSVAPEGLAALSFMADDYRTVQDKAREFTSDITVLDTGLPGVDLFICTMGGVPMEFMGSYEVEAMRRPATLDQPMDELSGRRILVTGASGVVAFPLAAELAKSNEVFAVARFSDSEQKLMLEAAGAHTIAFDLANPDLSALPESVDVVINYAVLPPTHNDAYEVNAGTTGRLAKRYRECQAFVHGSTGSLYAYQGERPLREDDPYGLHGSAENYAASKIAAEFLLKHLSVDYQLPVVLVRIFSFYGPRGGGVTQRIDQIIRGEPVSVYPGVRNVHTPLYQDDYVEKTIAATGIAKVGAEIVNVGGTEAVTTQEYCQMAGEILGKEPTFVENSAAWPIWADTSKMVRLLGPNKVSVREGVRRTIEAAQERLNTAHHVIGEPAKV